MRFLRIWIAAISLALLFALAPAEAQPAPSAPPAPPESPLKVAVRLLPPFVEEHNGQFTGFSVELWNAVALNLHVQSQFQATTNVQAQLQAVKNGDADVGVGAISITAARETEFDFSQPILNAGLQILTQSSPPSPESNALQSLLHLLFSPAVLVWLGIAVLLTMVPAHIVWFVERNHEGGIIASKRYFPGIFQAFFWGLGALATQADSMPRHWISRIVAVLWMFTSVVFVAFYTAQLTASMTAQQIRGAINGPDDLSGKRVATIEASTSAQYLQTAGIPFITFPTAEAATQAVVDRRIDALVYDSPVLRYFATHAGAGQVQVVGLVFRNEDYGFAFRDDSPLRKRVDVALEGLRESGEYQRLVTRWFGAQ